MAVNVGDSLGTIASGASSVGLGIANMILWIVVIFVVGIIVAIVLFLYLTNKKYKYKIRVYKKINGRFERVWKGKAREIKHGRDGTTVFVLKKLGKILPPPTLQSAPNTYMYWVREDGEWINFEFGDFDEQAKQMNAHFLDKEMRMVRVGLEMGLEKRLEKKASWLAEHWSLVAGIGFLAILLVFAYLLFDKWGDLASATAGIVDNAAGVVSQSKELLIAMENVCTGGTGYLLK